MTRRVQQIAAVEGRLFALAEDGTLWTMNLNATERRWFAIESPPVGHGVSLKFEEPPPSDARMAR